MSKAFNWIGGIFLLFGLVFAGVGAGIYWKDRDLAATGDRAQGTVVELEWRRDSDGDVTYRPVVEFRDAGGARHRFTSSVGSNPAAFSRGEEVEVIYDAWSPSDAMIDSFTTRYLLPLAFGGFGLVFGGIGGGMLVAVIRRKRIIADLKQRGLPIEAEVIDCYHDTSTKINGRSPYRVVAQATHPGTGQLQSFKSDPIWLDLSSQLDGKNVRVLVDMQRPKRYWVDLTEYVPEDERA